MDRRSATRHVQSGHAPPKPNRSAPGEGLSRLIVLALLCALLPPLGLAFLWRSRRTTMAARIALSMLSVCLMTIALSAYLDGGEAPEILPVPVAPTSVAASTPVPASVMAAPGLATMPLDEGTPAGEGAAVSDGAPAGEGTVAQQGLEIAYVYAYTGDATHYHAIQDCDGQVNDRILTLEQAMSEALVPCEKCFAY